MKNINVKVLLSTTIGLIVVLTTITTILLIKVNRLEENIGVKVNTEVDSVDLDAYLEDKYVEVNKGVDEDWEKWKDVRYNYGFDSKEQPVFNTVNGVLESDTMISVRGGKGRWNNRFVSG